MNWGLREATWRLRRQGLSYPAIGRRLGVSAERARGFVWQWYWHAEEMRPGPASPALLEAEQAVWRYYAELAWLLAESGGPDSEQNL